MIWVWLRTDMLMWIGNHWSVIEGLPIPVGVMANRNYMRGWRRTSAFPPNTSIHGSVFPTQINTFFSRLQWPTLPPCSTGIEFPCTGRAISEEARTMSRSLSSQQGLGIQSPAVDRIDFSQFIKKPGPGTAQVYWLSLGVSPLETVPWSVDRPGTLCTVHPIAAGMQGLVSSPLWMSSELRLIQMGGR